MSAFSWLPDGNVEDARDAMEQNEAMQAAAKQAMREKARLFYDVFGVGRGPELLELLRSETLDVDLMNITATIGNGSREIPVNPAEWAYHRNGQNSVVRYLEAMTRLSATVETEENPNV